MARELRKRIAEQLRSQGLRFATSGESGWYVIVETAKGETRKVWATDEGVST